MQLLTLPNEVLVEIAKHLEPHDPSMGAFRMLGKSTRDLTVVRHKPAYCGRIMELPWLHALWPGVVLRNLIIRDSFRDRVLRAALHGATYPHVHSLQLDRVLSPHSVKNVFKVFPNLKELIAHRSAICVHRHRTLQSEHQSDHTDAMVDFWLNKLGHKSLKFCGALNGATKCSRKVPGTVGTEESALKKSIQQSRNWPRPAAVFQTGIQCKMTISLLLLQPTFLRLGGSPTAFVVLEAHGCVHQN